MLIDFSAGRVTFDPREYPGTLAVRLDTGHKPGCGVVSGRNDGFRDESEMEQPMPRLSVQDTDGHTFDDLGVFDFLIDRPNASAGQHECLRYNYVVTGWKDGVYYEHPSVAILTLHESFSSGFHVSYGGVDFVLPDYEPGWTGRREPDR